MAIEGKVITINVGEIDNIDDLGKILAEKITETIEEATAQRDLAEKAFETWLEVKDQHIADIKIACGGKLPEGEHLMSLMFAGGFREGYQAKEAECSKCD